MVSLSRQKDQDCIIRVAVKSLGDNGSQGQTETATHAHMRGQGDDHKERASGHMTEGRHAKPRHTFQQQKAKSTAGIEPAIFRCPDYVS